MRGFCMEDITVFKDKKKIHKEMLNIFNDIHDYEIEYEYLKEHDGIKTFNEILHPFHMKYEKNCPSKIARAFDYILCSKR